MYTAMQQTTTTNTRARPVTTVRAAKNPETFTTLWHRRLVELAELGLQQLNDRKLPPARRIQKARQATKAARALLRLAPDGLKRQARGLNMALAGARRQLGTARDQDAMAETLLSVGKGLGVSARQLQVLLRPMRAPSGAASAHADSVTQASATIRRVLEQLRGWKPPRGRDLALFEAIEQDFRRLRRDSRPGLPSLDIEDLHDFRKRAITHRHQVALVALYATENKAKIERRAERARRLHEAIGDHRDLYLLGEHLRGQPDSKTYALREQLIAAIEQALKQRLATAVRLQNRLTRYKPRKLLKKFRQRLV
jgi:hypothetical protein